MTSIARLVGVRAGAQVVQGRRSLAVALEEAGLDGAPVVVADQPSTERLATTIKVPPAERGGAVAAPAAGRADPAGTGEIVLEAYVVDEPDVPEDDIWSLEMSPPPPWLKPQRAKRRSRWRAALVTGSAWVATLLITGLIVGGVGYALTKFAPPQLMAIKG